MFSGISVLPENAGEGGKGLQTRGMEKTQAVGNPNRQWRDTRY